MPTSTTGLRLACIALLLVPMDGARAVPDATLMPSGQFITPLAAAGAQFMSLDPAIPGHPGQLADQAVTSVVSPDGRTLLVLTSGYNSVQTAQFKRDPSASSEYVFVYDIAARTPRQTQVLRIPTAYAGIAFAPDGQRFHVGSGGGDSLYSFRRDQGRWVQDGAPIPLGHASGIGNRQGPSTAGLAVTADGSRVLIADVYNDAVSLVDPAARRVVASLDLRPGDGVAGGESPFWVAIFGNRTAYVSSLRDREIDVLALTPDSVTMQARIAVRGTPNRMVLNRDGTRLYVACDNDDSVQVIDTTRRVVTARIPVAFATGLHRGTRLRYRGAAPNALRLSADERTLYVTNGGENAVAVVDLGATPHASALLPTGYYPNDVSVAGDWLYVINGKSDPGPNPAACQDHVTASRPTPEYASLCRPNQYVLQHEVAGLLAFHVPNAVDARALTLQVGLNDGFARKADPRDAAMMAALHRRIHHVIYIVKENRTYDQILGDLGRGDGDPGIVEFGRAITPNFHALATDFVDLDNFFDSGAVSGNGWQWSTASRETDVNVKTIPLEYSSRKTNAPYESEGQNRGVDVGLTPAQRHAAEPSEPDDPNLLPGSNDDAAPDGPKDDDDDEKPTRQHGYLWDAAFDAGLSVRNYGFFYDLDRYGTHARNFGASVAPLPEERMPFATHTIVGIPVDPELVPVSDVYFRGFDNAFPDTWRYAEWNREFTGYERSGTLPSLELVRLMHDHMGNFADAIDGIDTPETQQADNDYAVGLLIDRVAHSRFAKDTLIFVIEDDAQDGPDHVDAHRSTAYVAGPYVRHGEVVHTRYGTVNMLRTIEDVLGTRHLALNDAYQPPMTDIFDLKQANWSFDAVPSRFLLGTGLKLREQHADAARSSHDAAWWTARTLGFDWSHEDRVPAVRFNQIVWDGLRPGQAYPTQRQGAPSP